MEIFLTFTQGCLCFLQVEYILGFGAAAVIVLTIIIVLVTNLIKCFTLVNFLYVKKLLFEPLVSAT